MAQQLKTLSTSDTNLDLKGTGFRGLIAVNITSGNLTLKGAIGDGVYYDIETFNGDTLKEVTLCPQMKIAVSATATAKVFFDNESQKSV